MLPVLFAAALLAPVSALACPGAKPAQVTTASAGNLDPTACAKSAALVGAGCTWSTHAMAVRVNSEGRAAAVTAKLAASSEALASEVAAPYRAGAFYVIANEVIESIDPSSILSLSGKVLEVEGVTYLLVTSVRDLNS
jgi:hypothetical protein